MYDLNQIISTAQTNLAKPTENQLAKAKYYGYTDEQVNQEMNKLQPNTAPQSVATPQITPTTPQPATPPTQPAPVAPQPEVKPTGVTTPTDVVERDILPASVTGINPNQAKLDQANLNKLNSNLSIYSTGKALYDGVQGGSILPGTKEFTDLTTRNPQVLADYNLIKADKVKTDTVKALGQSIVGEPIQTKPSNALEQLVSFFTKSMDTDVASEYQNSVINNPAYQASIQNMNGINQQIADNNKNINALREDVRQKYSAGTPESLIASAIAREARPLIEQGQYLAQLQENAQSEMTRLFEENKQVFDLKQEEITNNRNIALQLYGTIRAEEIRQEDIEMADRELQQKMEQAKSEQEYLMYKDERDYNLKVAEAMQKSGQWESEFDLKAAEFGLRQDEFGLKQSESNRFNASDYLKTTIKDADGSEREVFINPTTGQRIDPIQAFGDIGSRVDLNAVLGGYSARGQELLSVPDGTVIPTRLGQVSPQNAKIRGKECAEYVNDIAGTKMGNTYAEKQAVCNEPTGGVGSVVAWQPNGSGNFGHTGIIVDEDADYYYVKSSNYVPGTVTTEPVPKQNIQNFYTPEAVKMQKIPPVSRDILSGIEDLLDSPGLGGAVGFGLQKLNWGNQSEDGFLPGTEAENFRAKFNSFRDNMVLPNLSKLKGPMSDKDIQFLRNSATSLSLNMTEKQFKAELLKIKNKIMGISEDDLVNNY